MERHRAKVAQPEHVEPTEPKRRDLARLDFICIRAKRRRIRPSAIGVCLLIPDSPYSSSLLNVRYQSFFHVGCGDARDFGLAPSGNRGINSMWIDFRKERAARRSHQNILLVRALKLINVLFILTT
jgi:hypothetical protein